MSTDYPLERYPVITDDRSLRRERFLPESSSTEPMEPKGESNNADSKSVDRISRPPTDGYNMSRRFASRPFSPLSGNGADDLGQYTRSRLRGMLEGL